MTKFKTALSTLIGASSLVIAAGSAHAGAADIELFSSSGSLPPNIMILLDSSCSMQVDPGDTPGGPGFDCTDIGGATSKAALAKAALIDLVEDVNDPDGDGTYEDNARFGLMEFREHGGTLLHPIADNATGAMITAINTVGDDLIGTPLSGAMIDIARYFAGPDGYGSLDPWGDIGSENAGVWASPFDLACRNSYVIFISDGEPYDDDVDHSNYWATFGDADGEDGEGSGDVGTENFPFADDVAYHMSRNDFKTGTGFDDVQSVVVHVIGFDIDNDYLEDMAEDGQGNYYTTGSSAGLTTALSNITTAIYDGQATFSTAVVPTSRTLFDASFYNAYFIPDGDAPMWEGHLDAYGLLADGTIVEGDGATLALDADGQFNDPPSPYWDAAEELRTNTSRNLYTNKAGSGVDFTTANVTAVDLDVSGASGVEIASYPNSSTSGIDTEGELYTALMRFFYGQDGFDDDDDNNYTEMRDYVLGDIFHSSPRIIGRPSRFLRGETAYNTFYTNNVTRERIVYTGANDGMLHAFEAGTYHTGDNPATTLVVETYWYDQGDGDEKFGWVPGAMLDDVKNVPLNSSHSHYFVDGSPSVGDAWLGDGTGADTSKSVDEWATVLVTGMREGGDSYLALDITNPASGAYPGFLWEFTDGDLGQTWSDPVITRIKLQGGSSDNCHDAINDGNCLERWVAIFGGGYTPNDEGDPNSGTFVDPAVDATGRAIYIVALDDGSIIAKAAFDASDTRVDPNDSRANGLAEMKYAIPSTPTVLDLNFDGFADVVYIGDLGGQLWKWDISGVGVGSPVTSGDSSTSWPVGIAFSAPVATLTSGDDHYRNLFYPPSASMSRGTLLLAFGSGERQDLRGEGDTSVDDENRFYVMKDKYPTGGNAFNVVVTEAELTDITVLQYDNVETDSGYYVKARESEKFVNDFSTFAGYVQATSYVPTSADPCVAASGESFVYQFRASGGQGLYGTMVGAYDDARRSSVGAGMASAPRVSMSTDPSMDKIFVKTSKGKVITEQTPPRDGGNASMIYWKQNF